MTGALWSAPRGYPALAGGVAGSVLAILTAVVDERESRVGVSWMQVAGAALAAVSSAVLLSTLGVAGTVIGAALGSVVATLGTAVYTRTLDASRQQVAARAVALRRVPRSRGEPDEADETVLEPTGRPDPAAQPAAAQLAAQPVHQLAAQPVHQRPAGTRPSWRLSGRRLSWKRLAVVTAAVFVAAMVAISAF